MVKYSQILQIVSRVIGNMNEGKSSNDSIKNALVLDMSNIDESNQIFSHKRVNFNKSIL